MKYSEYLCLVREEARATPNPWLCMSTAVVSSREGYTPAQLEDVRIHDANLRASLHELCHRGNSAFLPGALRTLAPGCFPSSLSNKEVRLKWLSSRISLARAVEAGDAL